MHRLWPAVVGAYGAILVALVALGGSFGHDEAVYAVGARALLEGGPHTGVGLHRPIGMKLLAGLGLPLHGGEWPFRAVMVVTSVAFLIVFLRLGTRVVGALPALWTAAGLLTSFELLRRSAELLSDVPSLLLLCCFLLVLVTELERPGGPTRRLLALAPLAAATYYVRYGASSSLLAAGVGAALIWHRELWRARGLVALTAGATALLLVPHAILALRDTGSVLGIAQASSDLAGRDYVGQGLVQFPRLLLIGGGGLVILFTVGLVGGAVQLRARTASRPEAFLWLAGALQIVATGLVAHGELRYFFPGISAVSLVGARIAVPVVARQARVARIAPLLAAVAIALAALGSLRSGLRLRRTRAVVVDVATLLRRHTGPGDCSAASAFVPEMTWYSGCAILRPASSLTARITPEVLVVFSRSQESRFVLARAGEGHRPRLVGEVADGFGRLGDGALYQLPRRGVSWSAVP